MINYFKIVLLLSIIFSCLKCNNDTQIEVLLSNTRGLEASFPLCIVGNSSGGFL